MVIGLNGDRNDKPSGSNSKPSAERPPSRSGSSSSRSTPSLKTRDVRVSINGVKLRMKLIIFVEFRAYSWTNQAHREAKDAQLHRMPHRTQLKMQFRLSRPAIQIRRINVCHQMHINVHHQMQHMVVQCHSIHTVMYALMAFH